MLDFDEGRAALDAVLTDSRLCQRFPITGEAAVRARFGSASDAHFVLAVGGLHPRFTPPGDFPPLQRAAIALCAGDNPRLVCRAYFAITSNTLQFGAQADLYVGVGNFSLTGAIGFDVLVQLVPLHFVADYRARLQLKRGRHNLFGVELAGELEGPRPLRIGGRATFKILWFHYSVRFDTTLVGGRRHRRPPRSTQPPA